MLTIKNLTKSIGGRTLFEDASMTINYGERVALVGANGTGKTTLFKQVLGLDEPDKGEIVRDEWTTIGFLPQETDPVGDHTALQIATGQAGEIEKFEAILKEHEDAGTVDDPAYTEATTQHGILTDPSTEAKAKKMLRGLGFRESDWERPATELSGGWVMRAHLARLLVLEPELLMLDEPTNHLDLLSLLWFQDYLKNYSGAIFLISHDREFMDEIIEVVKEIEHKKVVSYTGNYSDFVKQKKANYERAQTTYKNKQKEVDKVQDFVNQFRGVGSKASQVQSKMKQIEKMKADMVKPEAPRKVFKIQFPQPQRSGQRVIALNGVSQSYGKTKIYENVDLEIQRGEKIVLVGPNGAGKSTLLKILAGVLPIDSGERKLGSNLRIGYFSQNRLETLNENNSVLDEVTESNPSIREDEARGVLGSFLFRKDDVFKKVRVLSGGEKSRLNLVKFLVDPPNLLLMDEPSTHLDLLSIEALIWALKRYEGTLVFISHDVHFIKSLADKVLHISAGKITPYAGDYQYFLEKTNALDDARAAVTAGEKLGNEQV